MKKIFFALLFCISINAFAYDQYTVNNQLELTATTTSTVALPLNLKRTYLLIINKGAANILVKFGSAHSGTEGVVVVPNGNYEPFKAPVDPVYIRSASGSQAMLVLEGQY